jgi:hypothetical protein
MMDSLVAPQCSTTVAYVSDTVDDGKQAQAIALLRTDGGDVGFLIGVAVLLVWDEEL